VAVDSSGHVNNGNLNGGAIRAAGLYGGAVYLDGGESYVSIPNILTPACTVAFWFKPDWNGTDALDYRLFDAGTSTIYFFIGKGANHTDIGPGEFGFYFEDAVDADWQNIEIPAAGNIVAGTWYHVTVTWEFGGGPAILYLNGEEIARGTNLGGFPTLDPNPRFGYQTVSYIPMRNGAAAVIDDIKIFSRVVAAADVPALMEGAAMELASAPNPVDKAGDVLREVVLRWTRGAFANSHDVYFGTVFADVNEADRTNDLGVLVSRGQDANVYDPPGLLEFGQTYYWRIDEVNAPPSSTVFRGAVWSFTTEPLYYTVKDIVTTASIPTAEGSGGPEVTVDESGLTAGLHGTGDATMWSGIAVAGEAPWLQYDFGRAYKLYGMHIWNYNGLYEYALGFGAKDITIEYAVEPNEWLTLGDYALARGTSRNTYAGQLFDLGGLSARSIRININSTQNPAATQVGLSEIQFLHKPVFAREPQPADGATEVSRSASLGWRAGREAATHQIHFGTDAQAVADGTALVDSVVSSTYSPGALTLGTTYYWKVDEVNDVEVPAVWAGDLWSFTTQEYVSIDNFESYSDDEGDRIYQTWLDGYDITANGSIIGHDKPPYAEKTVIHRGMQSMPFYYNNTGSVNYSEAERTFASPQDWTANGADTLSLYYRGDPVAFLETSPGNIVMSGVGADIYQLTDEFRYAYKQLTGDGSITARVDSIQNTNDWAKAGVMIRATLETGTMQAHMVAAPTDRVEWMPRLTAGTNATGTATDVGSTPLPYWVRVTRQGSTFTGQYSADGQTWTTVAGTTPATIAMPNTVYIGLVVCSHAAGIACAVEFSSVSTTGNVTGQWELAAVGVDQPAGNGFDTFYLAVEDSSSKRVTVTHPDPHAVSFGTWQQWTVPLSDLTAAGLKANSVKKLVLGVGDRSKASQNASGVLYIDDIGFGRPIPAE
jgi:regulation of enolase protein 1 (concanavalin A-like superfamily)